jgi:flagellar protein FlaG
MMTDGVNIPSESLGINNGERSIPSPPPSSAYTRLKESGQAAAVVDLGMRPARQAGKTNGNEGQPGRVPNTEAGKTAREKELEEELKEAIDALNKKLGRLDREVLFKIDKRINKSYISVIDKETKEIIREFPPEEIRTFIARFDEINEKLNLSVDVKSLLVNLEV